ncbi:MAG: hypothetical protein J6Z35_09035 [Lachnospiraceae bacterium]|nr:hypothetical protein [Lachnospiraceae bacterium]
MQENKATEKEIDELVQMIEGKMADGVSRLKVGFSDIQESGTVREQYHHGRCDVGSPWANGSVSNCEVTDHI